MNVDCLSLSSLQFSSSYYDLNDILMDYTGSYPDFPIEFSVLRYQLQNGLMHDARVIWWPLSPQLSNSPLINSLPNVKESSVKRYTWARQRALSYDHSACDYSTLDEVQSSRVDEILLLLLEMMDFEATIMKMMIKIIVLVIPSNDICFHICSHLLSRKNYFLSLTATEHQLRLQTFREIVSFYLKTYPSEFENVLYSELESLGLLDDVYLNHIFLSIFSPILPFSHVLRIMDMYLLEGAIVLYRIGLGLLSLYLYLLKDKGDGDESNFKFRSGMGFWSEVSRLSENMEFSTLFQASLLLGNRSFFRSFFSSSIDFTLTTESISQYEQQAKETIQSQQPRTRNRRVSISSSLPPSSLRIYNSIRFTSHLLTPNSLSLLFPYLSTISLYSIDHFTLSFATHQHGYSLHTLFSLTQHLSPTLLILRSLQKKALIGLYLDDSIRPISKVSKGKGMSAIFRIDEENEKVIWYSTVMANRMREQTQQRERRQSLSELGVEIEKSEKTEIDSNYASSSLYLPSAYEDILYQYCLCNHENILIGGSVLYGSNAIRICSDLRTCSCGPSDTYGNTSSLVPEEEDMFIIEDIEVYCGHIAMEDFVERHSV